MYNKIYFSIIISDSNGTAVKKDNSTNEQTVTRETGSRWMRHVMFGIFGLAGLLFLITLIYMYSLKHQQIKRPAVAKTT